MTTTNQIKSKETSITQGGGQKKTLEKVKRQDVNVIYTFILKNLKVNRMDSKKFWSVFVHFFWF